jgi:hypothetical protein
VIDVPREENGAYGSEAGDENEGEADAVDREMIFHAEHWHPRDPHDRVESRKIGNRCFEECDNARSKTRDSRREGDPTCKGTWHQKQHDRSGKGDVNGPGDHFAITMSPL